MVSKFQDWKCDVSHEYCDIINKLINNFRKESAQKSPCTLDNPCRLTHQEVQYISVLMKFKNIINKDHRLIDLFVIDDNTALCNLEVRFNNERELSNCILMLKNVNLNDVLIGKYYRVFSDLTPQYNNKKDYENNLYILNILLNITKEKGVLKLNVK